MMIKKTFHPGGIHPDPCKYTADSPITAIRRPKEYKIPLSQSIGVTARPVVKPKDHVKANQMIAEATGFVSVPVHTPVDGRVKKIEDIKNPQGQWQQVIVIEPDSEELEFTTAGRTPLVQDYPDPLSLEGKRIIELVKEAGVVGMGGATFPTHVKLTVPEGKKADTVIINGAECEPYLTCDDRLMREYPGKIIAGTRMIMRATGATHAIIGIEANKPEAITAMKYAAEGFNIDVIALRTRYPQGGEKQLIQALTKRRVPISGLPVDVGCIVDNVATAAAVADAVAGIPLTRRVATVSGTSLSKPGNYLIEIGIPADHLLDVAGWYAPGSENPEHTAMIIAGGPMMGKAVANPAAPLVKGSGGIVVFPQSKARRRKASPCIRCAKCVNACPMGLEPYLLQLLSFNRRYDDCRAHGVMNCIECGCCSWSCPASRPLLDYIRLSKNELRKHS